MSYFLDPPALFLIGIVLLFIQKYLKVKYQTTAVLGMFIAFVLFMGGSTLLYLDVIRWPIPDTKGSVWMFHTNYTGIKKEDVPVPLAAAMLLIYPLWLYLGYVVAERLTKRRITVKDPKTYSFADVRSRKEKEPARFAVLRDTDSRKLVRDALEALGGIEHYVKTGDKVLIKANICGGNPEKIGSFTSHEVVEEVVHLIRSAGGKPVVVDSDMIWTEFWPVAEQQGWKEWAKRLDVPLINLGETDCAYFDFGEGSATGKAIVSKEMIEADVVVSIPTMKTHLLTDVTLGMKNMYGTFPEIDKAKFHRSGIEDVIYEINKALTPNLTIVDGSIGGEAMGPLSSEPVYFRTIVASNDVVTADSICCQLMGYDPMDVQHIKRAHEEGLGDASVRFDLSALSPSHAKDGRWKRPSPEVTDFYKQLIETALSYPEIDDFFNVAADFLLFGTATIPVLMNLTPQLEQVLDDAFGQAIRSGAIDVSLLGRLRSYLRRARKAIGL